MALPDYTTQDAATYKANIDSSVANSVEKTGDTMTGLLNLAGSANPMLNFTPTADTGFPQINLKDAASVTRGNINLNTASSALTMRLLSAASAVQTSAIFGTDGNVALTGGSNVPTADSHLTRKDYVDAIPKLVMLDTPVVLVTNNSTQSATLWQTVDMSVVYAAAATAGATHAILRFETVAARSSTALGATTNARKTGSGAAADRTTLVVKLEDSSAATTSLIAGDLSETTVALDSNSDFDWKQYGLGTNMATYIHIVGYYV